MVRNVLSAMVMLLVAAGCQENQKMTVWGISGQGMDLVGRVGIQKNNAEGGAVLKYAAGDIGDVEPDVVGGYLIFFPTYDITVNDTPESSPLKDFFDALHARPYSGLEIVTPIEGHTEVRPNFIMGSLFTLDPLDNWGFVVEWMDGDGLVSQNGDSEVFVGIRGQF